MKISFRWAGCLYKVIAGILLIWQAAFFYIAIAWHDVYASPFVKFDPAYDDWLLEQLNIHPSWSGRTDVCLILFGIGLLGMLWISLVEREVFRRYLSMRFLVVTGIVWTFLCIAILIYTEYFVLRYRLYMLLILPELLSLMNFWILLRIGREKAKEPRG